MVLMLAAAAGACTDSRFVHVGEERPCPVVGATAPDYGGVDLHVEFGTAPTRRGRGVPKTMVIDRDGPIAVIWLGGLDARRAAALEQQVEDLLTNPVHR
jgi:hypothetical protein